MIATLAFAYIKKDKITGAFGNSDAKLELTTTPDVVKISINGVPQFKNKYVKTPKSFKLATGKHTIQIKRNGYKLETQTISVEGDSTRDIVLERTMKMAPVEISLPRKNTQKVWIDIDDGMVSGFVTNGDSFKAKGLSFGQPHLLNVYATQNKSKPALFRCKFLPNALSWASPYSIVLRLKEKKCVNQTPSSK